MIPPLRPWRGLQKTWNWRLQDYVVTRQWVKSQFAGQDNQLTNAYNFEITNQKDLDLLQLIIFRTHINYRTSIVYFWGAVLKQNKKRLPETQIIVSKQSCLFDMGRKAEIQWSRTRLSIVESCNSFAQIAPNWSKSVLNCSKFAAKRPKRLKCSKVAIECSKVLEHCRNPGRVGENCECACWRRALSTQKLPPALLVLGTLGGGGLKTMDWSASLFLNETLLLYDSVKSNHFGLCASLFFSAAEDF